MCCFQISHEVDKGTNKGWIDSGCDFDCPEDCTGSWNAVVDGSLKVDSTLAVINGGE